MNSVSIYTERVWGFFEYTIMYVLVVESPCSSFPMKSKFLELELLRNALLIFFLLNTDVMVEMKEEVNFYKKKYRLCL